MFRLKIVFVVLISSAVINADEFNSDCNPRIGVVEVDDRYWAGTPWEIEIEPIIPYNCELVSEDKKNCVDEFRNITFEFQNGGFTAHCNFWYCYINGIYLPFATRSLIIRFSKEHVRATAYRYTYQMSNIPWFDMYSRTIPFKYNYDTTLFNIKYKREFIKMRCGSESEFGLSTTTTTTTTTTEPTTLKTTANSCGDLCRRK